MSRKGLYVAGIRYPDPAGSQGSPSAGPRLIVLWTWLVAYLGLVTVACLSTTLDARGFAVTLGAPPVLLFIGLGILGNLTPKIAWAYAIGWAGTCGAIVYFSVLAVIG